MKPFLTAVSERFEFKIVKNSFQDAGFKLNYVEVGWGYSKERKQVRKN